MMIDLRLGDCRNILPTLARNSIDTCITDPPYGLSFMGKDWDHGVPGPPFWKEVLRVLKPGASLLAFGGTRTFHRLTCAIEDAGFEIRDCIMWLYGSGVNKVGLWEKNKSFQNAGIADAWAGWGGSLKPAWEPIIVAMKPREGTFAQNALKWGVAGLWVDGGRVPTDDNLDGGAYAKTGVKRDDGWRMQRAGAGKYQQPAGRWPANIIHDGSEEATKLFPQSKGQQATLKRNDTGSAARFFYCAKASKSERTAGGVTENNHPTVKPLALMRYLCKLTKTPEGGTVLDPFLGSGSTGVASIEVGRPFIGIEKDSSALKTAEARMKSVQTRML